MRHNNNATRHGVAQEPFMSDSQNFQSVLIENRVFPPSRDFVAGAGLNAERLAALHAQAEADHVGFRAGLAKKELEWQTPFTQSLDDSHAPNSRWFEIGSASCGERGCRYS